MSAVRDHARRAELIAFCFAKRALLQTALRLTLAVCFVSRRALSACGTVAPDTGKAQLVTKHMAGHTHQEVLDRHLCVPSEDLRPQNFQVFVRLAFEAGSLSSVSGTLTPSSTVTGQDGSYAGTSMPVEHPPACFACKVELRDVPLRNWWDRLGLNPGIHSERLVGDTPANLSSFTRRQQKMNKQMLKLIVRDAITALTIGLVVGFAVATIYIVLR